MDQQQEVEHYEEGNKWLVEAKENFKAWFSCKKSEAQTDEQRRRMYLFVARFSDTLAVVIRCNGCDVILSGRRNRCFTCLDVDLCDNCYLSGVMPEGHSETHHIMDMRFECDECGSFIVGTRYHCNECSDFDLCVGCHLSGKFPGRHTAAHKMTKFRPRTVTDLKKISISSHFASGLQFLEGFVQILNKTPYDISAIVAQRTMADLVDLVNKAHESFCCAQKELDKINNELDNDLQVIVVEEKTTNDQLAEDRNNLQKLQEIYDGKSREVRDLENQLDKERRNLDEAISFKQKKRDQLEKAKRDRPLQIGLGGLFGGLLGAGIAAVVSQSDVEKAENAVSEASAEVTRTSERVDTKKKELTNLKTELKEAEERQQLKSLDLKMLERRKEIIKQFQKHLARLNEAIKTCITLVGTTAKRTEIMANEANDELPDIGSMMIPLKAIADDLCETSFSNSSLLLSGSVDMKEIGFKIQMITSKEIQKITSDDIDQWA